MSIVDHSREALDEIPERWRSKDLVSISDSEIEAMIDEIYKANWSINLPVPFISETVAGFFQMFNCLRCGECCIGGGEGVFLNPDDVDRLSMAMRISKRQFKDKFTFVTEGKRFLPFPCPFYDSNSHLCTVYQSRPGVCRRFPLFPSPKRLYRSSNGAPMMMISARCPEGRKIAYYLLKIQRDALSCRELNKSKFARNSLSKQHF